LHSIEDYTKSFGVLIKQVFFFCIIQLQRRSAGMMRIPPVWHEISQAHVRWRVRPTIYSITFFLQDRWRRDFQIKVHYRAMTFSFTAQLKHIQFIVVVHKWIVGGHTDRV